MKTLHPNTRLSLTLTLATLLLTVAGFRAHSATYLWGNVGNDWNTAANWTVAGSPATVPPGSSDVITFPSTAPSFQPNLSAASSVARIAQTRVGWTISSSSSSVKLQLMSAANVGTFSAISFNQAGSFTFTAPVDFGAASGYQTIYAGNAGGTISFNGEVSSVNPGVTLTKDGPGLLNLNGVNTFTSALIVSNGVLMVNGSTAAGSAITVRNGAILGGTGTIGGALTLDSGAIIRLTNGVPLVVGGSLTANNNTVNLYTSNNVTIGTYTLATYNDTGSSGTLAATPVVVQGSFELGTTNYITTTGGNVVLHVEAAATPPGTTFTTVTSSLNPSYLGQTATFTATIAPAAGTEVPTGSVQFKTNGTAYGSAVTVTPSTPPYGTASIAISDLPVGAQAITAEYTATGSFLNSVGNVVQTVNPVPTTFAWANLGSGNWNTSGNWSPAGPPYTSIALIQNGGTAIVTQNALYPVSNLRVGYDAGTSGALNIDANLTATGDTQIGRAGNGTINITNGVLRIVGETFRLGVTTGSGTGTQSGGVVAAGATVFIGVQGTASYSLTGGSLLASNNITVAGSSGSSATLSQSGGEILVGNAQTSTSGQAFVGQSGTGVYNLSSGTLKCGSLTIGSSGTGNGTVTQTGGNIDLLTGPIVGSGSVLIGSLGVGVYSISNGILNAANLIMTNGTFNIWNGSTVSLANGLVLDAPAKINFHFGNSGVSGITAGGPGIMNPGATITVDGSAYTGGPGYFTVMKAASFDNTPSITLLNFAQSTSYVWDPATGKFTVLVGTSLPPAPVLSSTIPGAGTDSTTINFSSVNGATYTVTAKTNLLQPAWEVLGSVNAAGATSSFIDTNGPFAERYFRVVSP